MTSDRQEPAGKDYSVQRLLLGTHTSDNEQNYVMLAECQLPLEDSDVDARCYDDTAGRSDVGGYGAGAGKVRASGLALQNTVLCNSHDALVDCNA